jgi:hypothetical protein
VSPRKPSGRRASLDEGARFDLPQPSADYMERFEAARVAVQRSRKRRGWGGALLLVVLLGGISYATSRPSSPNPTKPQGRLTAAQDSEGKHLVAYANAVGTILLPFTHRIANASGYRAELINLRRGAANLDSALAQLDTLKPPRGLASEQQRLINALKVEATMIPRFISAATHHDAVGLSNLAATDVGTWGAVNGAIHSLDARVRHCEAHLGTC